MFPTNPLQSNLIRGSVKSSNPGQANQYSPGQGDNLPPARNQYSNPASTGYTGQAYPTPGYVAPSAQAGVSQATGSVPTNTIAPRQNTTISGHNGPVIKDTRYSAPRGGIANPFKFGFGGEAYGQTATRADQARWVKQQSDRYGAGDFGADETIYGMSPDKYFGEYEANKPKEKEGSWIMRLASRGLMG